MSDKSSRRIVGYDHVRCSPTLLPEKMTFAMKRGWEPHGHVIPWINGEVLQYVIRRECNLPDWFHSWTSDRTHAPVSLDDKDRIDVMFHDGIVAEGMTKADVVDWTDINAWRYAE